MARKPYRSTILVGISVLCFLFLLSSLAPAVFAVLTVTTTPSLLVASPNTTINLANTVSMDATPFGNPVQEQLFYVVVLQTSTGNIFGCIISCFAVFQSGATTGSGTCNTPFGGTASSLSTGTTGGVTFSSACSGSDSSAWSSDIAGGGCTNNPCNGASDFAALNAYCNGKIFTSPGFGLSTSTGDTSQPGIYEVSACWVDGSSNGMTSQTSFTIESFVTPVFPLGTILAVIAPLLALGCYMIISMKRKAAIAN